MNRIIDYFRRLSIKYKLVVFVVIILVVLAIGVETFVFKYLWDTHRKGAKDFAVNLSDSLSLNIRQDYAVSDIFALDRFFLGISQEEFSGVRVLSVTLVDNNHRIIADMKPERYGQKHTFPKVIGDPAALKSTVAFLYEEKGKSRVVSVRPVFSNINRIGLLVLTLSTEAYERRFYAVVWITIGLTVVFVFLLGWLLIVLLHDSLVKPILSLAEQTAEYSKGRFRNPVELDRSDELGQLGNVLESMRENVVGLFDDMEANIDFLKEAKFAIEQSEEKYRILVEGSKDIIFILDDSLCFRHVNNAVRTQLGFDPTELPGSPVTHLFHVDPEGKQLARNLIEEQLDEFVKTRKRLQAKLALRSAHHNEPLDHDLSLEYIDIGGRYEILGKLSLDRDDHLAPFFQAEKQKFIIGNHMTTAVEISIHLVRNLHLFFERSEIAAIQLGLQEMIVNAIEHGNLGISFATKSEVVDHEGYMELITRRQHDPQYRDRKVVIDYRLDPHQVAFRIEDEGDGFDHRAVRSSDRDRVNEEMLSHGRGLTIAENVFDCITYNDKGNRVTLSKNIYVQRPDKLFKRTQ